MRNGEHEVTLDPSEAVEIILNSESSLSPPPQYANLKKKKKKIGGSSNTITTLNSMASTLFDLKLKGIPSSCTILVERTCKKLPFLKQVKLLSKLSTLIEKELIDAEVTELD